MEKRNRTRAIIFFEGKIVSMYREFEGRKYYTFPGGGMEEAETEDECVRREVLEEFGLTVKPIKKVYIYENDISVEHFYICEWLSGEFGSGTGEEFQPDRNRGVYKPTLISISDIPKLPLMPPEVSSVFYEDFSKNGEPLRDEVLKIVGKIRK